MTDKSRTPWSDEDLETLRREYKPEWKDELIRKLGRSWHAISTKAGELCLTRPTAKRVNPEYRKTEQVADQIKERDERAGLPRTLGMDLMGDPLPGRSALDGWIQRGKQLGHDPPPPRPRPWHPLRDGKREVP